MPLELKVLNLCQIYFNIPETKCTFYKNIVAYLYTRLMIEKLNKKKSSVFEGDQSVVTDQETCKF